MKLNNFRDLNFLILCIVITLGTVGNIFSIKIWSTGSRCKRSAFANYFWILAIVDIFVLLVPGLNSLLQYVPNHSLQLETMNELTCKLLTFSKYFGIQLSTWVGVAVTTECMFAFCFPVQFYHRKNKDWCICISLFFLTLALAIFNTPAGLSTNLFINETKSINPRECRIHKLDMSNIVTILTYLSSVGFFITLPAMIFIICDIIILCKMCLNMSSSTSMLGALTRNMKTTAKLVVLMNLLRTVTSTPLLFNIMTYFEIIEDPNIVDPQLLSVISNACLYFSNTVNIILYLIIKTGFRRDIQSLCRRKILPQSSTIRKYEDGPQDGALNYLQSHDSTLIQLEFHKNENCWI